MNDKTTIPKRPRVLRRCCRRYGARAMLTLLLLLCATQAYPQGQWTEVKLPAMPRDQMYQPYRLSHMEWADSLHGFIFAQYKGYYLKTTDGGGTWALDSLPATPDSLVQREFPHCSGVDFKDRDFGVVTYKSLRLDSLLFYTTDGGATWGYNPVSMPSPFTNTMNPPGSQVRVGADRDLYLYYTRQYDDSVIVNVVARSDDYGATWRELGGDTLNPSIRWRDHIHHYVLIDSLTHYSFIMRHDLGYFVGSWARFSADGAKHWQNPEAQHPLAHIGSYYIFSVRVQRDSTISLTLSQPDRDGVYSIAIVSVDSRQHQSAAGWYVYIHPFSYDPSEIGKFVDDILFDEGTYFVRMADTVVVFRDNPPERARKIRTPSHFQQRPVALYLQPGGRLCYLATRGLWILDYRTLDAAATLPAPSHDIDGFECYPQPFTRSAGVLTLRMHSRQRHEGVALVIYDATGRRLHEKEIGDIPPGWSDVHVDLSAASLTQAPPNSVLFIEVRTQQQRFYTKSLFLDSK
jgi:hypothetical protein